ncbi:MAG: 50S ribosomal protein L13 [Verrucomicrobia bacterium GWC2_42_7]|nr:MAG: 50S ribosomal protein L13 [Verrucomicrobia bacterium GWC2_42_7]
MKTTLANKETVSRKWYVVDASNEILGRLAVKVANILRGRHKVTYTPHVDTGDFVVIINAEKIQVTGKKEEKEYMTYSGYVGGEKYRTLASLRKKNPEYIIEHAVKGMLPKNKLAHNMITKMKVYAGSEHPHAAQNPIPLNS